MASGVAVLAGQPLEEIEDFLIVVDEVFATLVQFGAGQPIQLNFSIEGGGVAELTGSTTLGGAGGPEVERLALSNERLGVLADTHDIQRDSQGVRITVGVRVHSD
jgi:hypothetical protein